MKSPHKYADIVRVKPSPAKEKAPQSLALPGQRYVARQAILDRAQNVFGYEILFRNGVEDFFNADPELAARSTLDSSLLFGITTLCDNRRAFVNCTREVLFKDLITLLPPSQAVAEILETVEPEDRVIAACKRLKAAAISSRWMTSRPTIRAYPFANLPTSSRLMSALHAPRNARQ